MRKERGAGEKQGRPGGKRKRRHLFVQLEFNGIEKGFLECLLVGKQKE
jgi:hypothetical protein